MFDFHCTIVILLSSILNNILGEKVLFPELPVAVLETDNLVCKAQSNFYLENVDNFTLWAHEMWDSTAKSTTGLLRGNLFQMGNFDQCLSTKSPFLTKYCLIKIIADLNNIKKPSHDPFNFNHDPYEHILDRIYDFNHPSIQARNKIFAGWCIPASCTKSDIESYLNAYFAESHLGLQDFNLTYRAEIHELSCYTEEDSVVNLQPRDIAFCLVVLFLISLVIFASFYNHMKQDAEEKEKQKLIARIMNSFALKTNLRQIFSCSEESDEKNPLAVLFSMRTFCIFFVILGHRFGTIVSSALMNFDTMEKIYRSAAAPLIVQNALAADSFFILSGCLATYKLLKQFDVKMINPGYILLMRYLRLTPAYALVVFYYATMLQYTGSGPLWKIIVGRDSEDCRNNWWANLLYINNYVNTDHICMTHTWFLSADFHFLIIAIIICVIMAKNKKFGLIILSLLTVASIAIPFAIIIINQRPALLYFYPEFLRNPKSHPDFLLTYSKSHARATVYFIGMFTGWIYFNLTQRDNKLQVSKVQTYIILAVSVLLILISVFGAMIFYNPYHGYDAIEAAFFAVLHKIIYAVGSCGILLMASFSEHCNLIYKTMSWSVWKPLSKLVYGVYLVHMQFQLRAAGMYRSAAYFSPFDIVLMVFSDVIGAILVAIGLFLIIEEPVRHLIREILRELGNIADKTQSKTVVQSTGC